MDIADCERSGDKVIALAGNPNVGKSSVFNRITGLNQHTGNWPGKTVTNARGRYRFRDKGFILVDVPGTYSLMANSPEEEIARDFICFEKPDTVIIVADATCMERNLNLVLQILEIMDSVVVCVNLIDEARRKKITIDCSKLSKRLGVPVIPTSARNGKGIRELLEAVYGISHGTIRTSPSSIAYHPTIEHAIGILEPKMREFTKGRINPRWAALRCLDGDTSLHITFEKTIGSTLTQGYSSILKDLTGQALKYLTDNGILNDQLHDMIVTQLVHTAETIGKSVISYGTKQYNRTDRKIDSILTSKVFGIPVMLGLLALLFWITLTGANVPSKMLAGVLFGFQHTLTGLFGALNAPEWLHGILVLGMYRTLAWVVSVMLPPMAIFFPLFTLLEDLGYLPRVAFNLDNFFRKACAHGKQALTMCMGFGCNAAGVIGCRIIDSPRERLIAILTNVFVPCNGRFPTLIALITIMVGGALTGVTGDDSIAGAAYGSGNGILASAAAAAVLTGIVLIGIFMTLAVSYLLSKTVLKGLPSSFALELPPYRKPQIGRIIVRSILDRTLFVLGRAVVTAAPAGLVIWVMANVTSGTDDRSLLEHAAGFLDPFGRLLGMDGHIILAFILGFPANEIVVPILIMSYMASGSMVDPGNLEQLGVLFSSHGWTWLTPVCMMLFSLMHFPCGTTLWTIRKETQSIGWTLTAFAIPTAAGIIICLIVANCSRLLGLA